MYRECAEYLTVASGTRGENRSASRATYNLHDRHPQRADDMGRSSKKAPCSFGAVFRICAADLQQCVMNLSRRDVAAASGVNTLWR
eukprot:6209015-Pleurochrysis_carterae.AAC.2